MTSSPTQHMTSSLSTRTLWLASGLGCITLAAGWLFAVHAISNNWSTMSLLLAGSLFTLNMYFILKLVLNGLYSSIATKNFIAHQVMAILILLLPIVYLDNATPENLFVFSAMSIGMETILLLLLLSTLRFQFAASRRDHKERESVE